MFVTSVLALVLIAAFLLPGFLVQLAANQRRNFEREQTPLEITLRGLFWALIVQTAAIAFTAKVVRDVTDASNWTNHVPLIVVYIVSVLLVGPLVLGWLLGRVADWLDAGHPRRLRRAVRRWREAVRRWREARRRWREARRRPKEGPDLLGRARPKEGPGLLGRALGAEGDRSEEAWQKFLESCSKGGYIVVMSKEGRCVGGRFGPASFAPLRAEGGQLLLEEEWKIENGDLKEPLQPPRVVWIRLEGAESVSMIVFPEVASEGDGGSTS